MTYPPIIIAQVLFQVNISQSPSGWSYTNRKGRNTTLKKSNEIFPSYEALMKNLYIRETILKK